MTGARLSLLGLAALALALAVGSGSWHPGAAARAAAGCRTEIFEGVEFAVCTARAGDDLRLFLNDAAGEPIATFERLAEIAAAEGARLVFAMNAGMYHPDRRPVGLYLEQGQQIGGLVTAPGPGNFGLLPNGVFCIAADRFAVLESRRYARERPDCRYATQSGPMLVLGGRLHPRFMRQSASRHVRNGVGVSADGRRAEFVISSSAVNFHLFARFFRDRLRLPDALYFDGKVSRLYAPEIGRADFGLPMGPMVGLLAAAE